MEAFKRGVVFFLLGALVAPSVVAVERAAVYALLTERTAFNRENFFVYRDADSGANHGFASGFFGSIENIQVDSACVDDPSAATGCTSDPARLDRQRGNVLRMSFAPLTSAQFAGVNFEEPEHWGAQPRGRGHDLRGASAVTFDVRSPSLGGIRVQFGVGGKTTEFMTIPQSASFTTLSIALDSLGPEPLDLSDVHLLFTVVTNGLNAPNGGTLLLDEIRFTPAPISRESALGLPVATQTFGVLPAQAELPGRVKMPPDQTNRNAATVYESALVVLALLDRGTADDRIHAKTVADTFVYAVTHDNRGLPLPAAPDGSTGLHSGYESGDIALLNDQGPSSGRAGDVRLAGFSAGAQLCGPSRYCPILDDATGGNAAFAILALVAAYRSLSNRDYLEAARTIGKWIYANLADSSATGFGGYFLGYAGGALPKTDVLPTKTIENNADIFAAFSQLASLEREQPSDIGEDEWNRRAAIAGDFVMQMFAPDDGRFFAGTVKKGTPASDGVVPNGPVKGNDVVNTFDFIDANTFAVLALPNAPRYRAAIDWRRPIRWLAAQKITISTAEQTFEGFSIVPKAFGGPEGIAWEFTGQAVAAMRLVDCLYGTLEFAATIAEMNAQVAKAQRDAPFGDGHGLVAATLQNGGTVPPREQCLSTPFQCIPARVGLAATAWALFADLGLNPLSTRPSLKLCPTQRRRAVRK